MKYYHTSWEVFDGDSEYNGQAVFAAENKRAANKIVNEDYYGKYTDDMQDDYQRGYRSNGCSEITETEYKVLQKYL